MARYWDESGLGIVDVITEVEKSKALITIKINY